MKQEERYKSIEVNYSPEAKKAMESPGAGWNYEPPIKQVTQEVQRSFDNGVMEAVWKCGFEVNREELARALAYDRGQYEKGFAAGYKKGRDEARRYRPEAEPQPVLGYAEGYRDGYGDGYREGKGEKEDGEKD